MCNPHLWTLWLLWECASQTTSFERVTDQGPCVTLKFITDFGGNHAFQLMTECSGAAQAGPLMTQDSSDEWTWLMDFLMVLLNPFYTSRPCKGVTCWYGVPAPIFSIFFTQGYTCFTVWDSLSSFWVLLHRPSHRNLLQWNLCTFNTLRWRVLRILSRPSRKKAIQQLFSIFILSLLSTFHLCWPESNFCPSGLPPSGPHTWHASTHNLRSQPCCPSRCSSWSLGRLAICLQDRIGRLLLETEGNTFRLLQTSCYLQP